MSKASLLLMAWVLLVPGVASAEIYKCKGPDGEMLFTADASQCPNARAHKLRGQVQSVDRASAPAASRPVPPSAKAARTTDDAGEARRWATKKRTAQHELDQARARLAYLEEKVTACNRGSVLWIEDEAGIRKEYSCNKVKREYAAMQANVDKLQQYVDHGLEEECRRSGCLPGWIR